MRDYLLLTSILLILIMTAYKNNLVAQISNQKNIALVYPEKLPDNRNSLIPFYDHFINQLINCSELSKITIIHRAGLKEKLQKKFPSSKISLTEMNTVQDIWIRDFAPFYFKDSVAYKGIYNPSYFLEINKKTTFLDDEKTIFYYASLDDNVGREMTKALNITSKNIEIVIDGGNFIHNGYGIGITTNRLISENESWSIQEINDFFNTKLGISKLIVLPVEPGDETGHIDGMVRFINQNTVLVGAYETDYIEGRVFMDKIANQLKTEFEVIRIYNQSPKKQSPDEFASAFWNYINYLQVGNTIFLPQYGIVDKDKAAFNTLDKYFNVVPVSKDIDKLSKLGGVLNCITWNY